MSVAVAFQDRLFMAVSTSGEDVNTLFYSEFDEFESMPDVNELPIQQNQKSNDVLTALVPFGSMLPSFPLSLPRSLPPLSLYWPSLIIVAIHAFLLVVLFLSACCHLLPVHQINAVSLSPTFTGILNS